MTDLAGMRESTPPISTLLTFLIADVRGYTHFTMQQGDEAAARLAGKFAAIAKEIASARGGEVLELRGDEALAVFASARQALRAALDLQDRYSQETEADPLLPLRIGIGLDAGDAVPVQGGYRGGALNLAARLCSIAEGGEIFCSETVIGLARKTDGIDFVDRGEVSLKGLAAPVRVIQIAPNEKLPQELPPLQPILAARPNNLPDEPTPFIGRGREIEEIARLLQDPHIRLMTLTGPGGTGKTRLALQVGNTLLYDFADGVFFVNLAPLTDALLVPSTIAEVLGVKEEAGKELTESLTDLLRDKHLLLVLDNFEHLLSASTVVASLLDVCRELHVLVTSRIPLHLSREHEYPVSPLSVPDIRHLPDAESLFQYESVVLFIERAQAVKPGFAVTNENSSFVAEICYRLDGLPLAIELAAARIKLLPPHALLQRLSSRLKLLTGGAKDRPSRQQTLRGTIDWSYSLLSDEEQALFVRLSVFAGACTFEAAEAVCNPHGELDLLEAMTSLVDKCLVRQEGEEESRFAMLETIREYATERLETSMKAEQLRHRHAEYFKAIVDSGERHLHPVIKKAWTEQVETEHENMRAALTWSMDAGEDEMAVLIALGLTPFWAVRSYFAEGVQWLEAVLEKADSAPASLCAMARADIGMLETLRGDFQRATMALEESLRLFRALQDQRGIARALRGMGGALLQQGDHDHAIGLLDESLALYRELADSLGVASCLHLLGEAALNRGDYGQAIALTEETITLLRERNDTHMLSHSLENLARVVLSQGDAGRAEGLWEESLRLAHEWEDKKGIAFALSGLAAASAYRGMVERAVRLSGAADKLYQEVGVRLSPPERVIADRFLSPARSQLDESTWNKAWQEGGAMSLEEAVVYAQEDST